MSDEWRQRAACRGKPAELFFPEQGQPVREAKVVCAECPVRVECLAAALELPELWGVWGGRSERERKRLRKGTKRRRRCAWCEKEFYCIQALTRYCSDPCRKKAFDARNRDQRSA